MNLGAYGIIVIIVIILFIILMIMNPNLSCFGRRLKSPLYPLLRKKKRKIKTEDYGFKLVDHPSPRPEKRNELKRIRQTDNAKKTDDYGFRLD